MKLRTIPLAALAAFTLAGPASATTTLLLKDVFEADNQDRSTFNTNLLTTQTGSLTAGGTTAVTYSIAGMDGHGWAAQHGHGGAMLLAGYNPPTPSGSALASLNHNFAADANSYSQALEIKFNLTVGSASTVDDWATIAIGAGQNQGVNTTNSFASLFRNSGGTQQFKGATDISGAGFTYGAGDLITLVLSDASGSGSAFNPDGATDVAKMYVNGTLANTYTGLNLTSTDGYVSFQAASSQGLYDNLEISVIPEPGAALLGGLGMLALLRRRR